MLGFKFTIILEYVNRYNTLGYVKNNKLKKSL